MNSKKLSFNIFFSIIIAIITGCSSSSHTDESDDFEFEGQLEAVDLIEEQSHSARNPHSEPKHATHQSHAPKQDSQAQHPPPHSTHEQPFAHKSNSFNTPGAIKKKEVFNYVEGINNEVLQSRELLKSNDHKIAEQSQQIKDLNNNIITLTMNLDEEADRNRNFRNRIAQLEATIKAQAAQLTQQKATAVHHIVKSAPQPVAVKPRPAPVLVKKAGPPGDITIEAVVSYLNGGNTPARYADFFLTKESLDNILKTAKINPPRGKSVENGSELWARSKKNPYEFPQFSRDIKSALRKNSVKRAMTKMNGMAKLESIPQGDYFIIGFAPLSQIGVVWSTPVKVTAGQNKIYLDQDNASFIK